MKRILLTSTSFQDTPGKHHDYLDSLGLRVDRLRGPLKEEVLLPVIRQYDGIICGDDEITRRVMETGTAGKLKIVSKYGIGVDKIDLEAARQLKLTVTNCPGVNHVTVAEHTFGLMLALARRIPEENDYVQKGEWKRMTGHEIQGKTLGVLGLGRVGKEVVKRALCFGMTVSAYDVEIDPDFTGQFDITIAPSPQTVLENADILTLHMPLTPETRHFLSRDRLTAMKKGVFIVNTSRGALIHEKAMVEVINSGHIAGYAADVVDGEPISPDNPLIGCKNVILTPHIGSRTYESVQRQAMMALENLHLFFQGKEPLARITPLPGK